MNEHISQVNNSGRVKTDIAGSNSAEGNTGDTQIGKQSQSQKGAADTFSEQAAKVQREGSTNRSVNDAIAKSHPQTARVENFSTKAENGQKMDVRVVPNAQTGQKDYFVAGKDGNYMPYKEVDGKLRPVDEGKKGDKAERHRM